MKVELSQAQINTVLKALQESIMIRNALGQMTDVSLHDAIAAIGRQALAANSKPEPQPEAPPSTG